MIKPLFLSLALTFTSYASQDRPNWQNVYYNGCNFTMRNYILIRDATRVQLSNKCKIISGIWSDAYTNEIIYDKSNINVDHVLPYAELKAHSKSEEMLYKLHNNENNLVISTRKNNSIKGDWSLRSIRGTTVTKTLKMQDYTRSKVIEMQYHSCIDMKLPNCEMYH